MFDCQLLANRHREFSALRQGAQRAAELFAFQRHPGRDAAALGHLDSFDDHFLGAARLGDADYVAYADQGRGNRDFFCVQMNMAMAHYLAGLRERTSEAETIDDVIETALEEDEKILAGDTV